MTSLLAHGVVRSMLLSFQVLGDFSVTFLILVSSLIPLWLKNMLCMVPVLNLLKFVLWPDMWLTFAYVPWALTNCAYSSLEECSRMFYECRFDSGGRWF